MRELNELVRAEMGRTGGLAKLPFRSYRELAASIGSSLSVGGGALENALAGGAYSRDARSAITALIRVRMDKILAAVRGGGKVPRNLLAEERRLVNALSYLEP